MVEVFGKHADIDVVVPWDEPAVAHGTEQGAAVKPVVDAVLGADTVYLFKDGELLHLAGAQLVGLVSFDIVVISH